MGTNELVQIAIANNAHMCNCIENCVVIVSVSTMFAIIGWLALRKL